MHLFFTIALCFISLFLGSKSIRQAGELRQKEAVIKAYQESLEDCEKSGVVDKIIDKMKERHND